MKKYKVPERVVSMTIHHLYGLSKPHEKENVREYLKEYGFALTADLIAQGFKASEIEEAVNSGDINVTHWPEKNPQTDFYWNKDKESLRKLEKLSKKTVEICEIPIGGDFASVGAEIGSQQMALAGLIYAREQGKLRETEMSRGDGPIYFVKGGPSEELFSILFPAKQ